VRRLLQQCEGSGPERHACHVAMAASAFACLVATLAPAFDEGWEIPVTVEAVRSDASAAAGAPGS
jgi:hypothetical protein